MLWVNSTLLLSVQSFLIQLIMFLCLYKRCERCFKALRTGAATSGLVATQEAIRYPFDPLATPQEAFMNIGTAFAIGTSFKLQSQFLRQEEQEQP